MAGPEHTLSSLNRAGTPPDGLRDRPSSPQRARTLRFAPSRKPSAPRTRPGPRTGWDSKTERGTLTAS